MKQQIKRREDRGQETRERHELTTKKKKRVKKLTLINKNEDFLLLPGTLAKLVSKEKDYQQVPGTTYAGRLKKMRQEDRIERDPMGEGEAQALLLQKQGEGPST